MAERPLELLLACHARIRRYCGGLQALCEVEPGDPRIYTTAQACQRYFGEALALHGADEDSSVLPRLRPHLSDAQLELAQTLSAQHAEIDALTPGVLAALTEISELDAAQRRARFEPFWALLLTHIELEESRLFSALDQLSAAEDQAIVREIRGRRR